MVTIGCNFPGLEVAQGTNEDRRALPLLVPVAAELAFELRLELAVDQHV